MELNISNRADNTVIQFNKNSVLGTEGFEFQDTILNTLDKGVNSIIIDMSKVEYITSWGIGMLVHAFTTTTNRNSYFSLSGVTDKVHQILLKVKLDTFYKDRNSTLSRKKYTLLSYTELVRILNCN